jgi:hypothetical protein
MSTDQEYWDACLIKIWRLDGKVIDAIHMFKSLTGGTLYDRPEQLLRTPPKTFPFKLRIRPFMAQRLEKISHRLWEQEPDKDVLLLRKLQTSKYDTTTQETQPDRELTNAREQYKRDRNRVGMNALQASVRNHDTDWNVTKGSHRGRAR